jgi:YD repeat-containing protein
VDSSGTTDYEWAAGQPVKVIKGDWVTELGYDAERRLATIRTPDGSTTYSYDGPTARYPSQVTNPAGGVTQLSYEGDRIARQVDADGVETKIGWELGDGKVDIASGSDPVASLGLSEDGTVTKLDAADQAAGDAGDPGDSPGNQPEQTLLVSTTAGGDGQPTGFDISTAQEKLTGRTFAYDDYGRVTKIDAPSESVSITYDDRGRVASRSTGDDHTETYEYDGSGHLIRTSVNGSVTMTALYDSAGRLIDQTVKGENVKRRYDADGLVSELTDYRGTWKVTRTKAGRAQSVTTPNGGTVEFTYDEAGRLARVGTPTGAATTYEYDEAGRIAKASRGGLDVTYSYRGDGKLDRITSPLGIDNFGYDDAGHLTSTNGPSGTWAVDYDSDGRPARLSEDSGSKDLAYDDLGRVMSVIDTRQGEDPVRTDYSYDDLGRLTGVTRGDDRTGIEYGAGGHPSKVSVGEDSEEWQWTPAGYLEQITAGNDNYVFNYENDRIKTIQRNGTELVTVDWSDQGPSAIAVEGEQLAALKWDNNRLSELTLGDDTLTIDRNGDGELSKVKVGDDVRAEVDWKDGIPIRTYSDDGEVAFACAGSDCEFGTGPLADGNTDDAKRVRLSYRAGVLTDASVDGLNTKFQSDPDGRIRSATRGDGDAQERGEVTPLGEITGDLGGLLEAVVGVDGVPNGPSTRTQFATAPVVDSLPNELRPVGLDLETPAERVQRTISSSIPVVPSPRALDDDDTGIASSVLRDILTDTQVSVPFGPFGERSDDMFDEGGFLQRSGVDADLPSVLSEGGWGAQYTQLYNALRPDPGLLGQLIEWGPDVLGVVVGFVAPRLLGGPGFWVLLAVTGIAAAGACFFQADSCAALSAIFVGMALPGPLGRLAKGGGVVLERLVVGVVDAAVNAGQTYLEGGGYSVAGTAFALGLVVAAVGPFARSSLIRGGCKLHRVVCYSALRFPETAAAYKANDGHRPGRLLTVDRGGAAARRRAALAGTPSKPGFDRDEYPPALTRQGGSGATTSYVSPSENRSAGAYLRDQLRDVEDGERFLFVVTDASSVNQRALDGAGLAAARSLSTEGSGRPPG